MTRRRTCPGGCGRSIRSTLFCCDRCLATLPDHVQQMVRGAAGKPCDTRVRVWSDATEHFARRYRRR